VDGGSSVAVLTYLRQILDALDSFELVDLILQYLFGLFEDASQVQAPNPRSPQTSKRRMSLMLLMQPDNEDDRLNPSLFSLIDLLLNSTISGNPQTVIAALRLITVVLSKDHKYCINTLLQVTPAADSTPTRTHGSLKAEIEAYLAVAGHIAGETGLDESYDNQLKDALRLIESHICTTKLLALQSIGMDSTQSSAENVVQSSISDVRSHYLRSDDVLFRHLLSALETFLTNNVELNLSVTETIINLAACPHLRLEGWAAVEPQYYDFSHSIVEESEKDISDVLRKLKQIRIQPTWEAKHTPTLLRQLQGLETEIQNLSSMVSDFPRLVTSRKQAFHLHEQITEAMQRTSPHPPLSAPQPSANWTPQKPQSLPQRIWSGASTPNRSQSPRGRAVTPDLRHAITLSPQHRNPAGASSPSPSRSRPLSGELVKRPPVSQSLLNDVMETANSEALARRITFPLGEQPVGEHARPPKEGEVADGTINDQQQEHVPEDSSEIVREATLSHILTNIVILQEFILEFVAVMQVRASMFGEVKFA
jgi:hypothetical protein